MGGGGASNMPPLIKEDHGIPDGVSRVRGGRVPPGVHRGRRGLEHAALVDEAVARVGGAHVEGAGLAGRGIGASGVSGVAARVRAGIAADVGRRIGGAIWA